MTVKATAFAMHTQAFARKLGRKVMGRQPPIHGELF
jgi:hypothetical protein